MLDRFLQNLSVEVEPFALCLLDSGWRLRLPGPPVPMLHFVVKGEGMLHCPNDSPKKVGPNWLVVIPAGVDHALDTLGSIEEELHIECVPEGPPVHRICAGDNHQPEMVVSCGTLGVRYGEALHLFAHLKERLAVDLSAVPEVPALFQNIIDEQSRDEPGGPLLQEAMMTQLLVHMFRVLLKDSNAPLPWLAALNDTRLADVLDVIMRSPGEKHTVESLAGAAAMSRSVFSKHFNEAFDCSPMNFVNQVRLERAAKLMMSGKMSFDELASQLGFSNRSHFSRAFKAHFDQSPSEYQKTIRSSN